MGWNWCKKCGGSGRIPKPGRRWWQFWKTTKCFMCGGDGHAKPPGWFEEVILGCKGEMERRRPNPPSVPDYLRPWRVHKRTPRKKGQRC